MQKVYAFEPDKEIADALAIGLCANNCFNVKSINCGLGSKEEKAKLYELNGNSYNSTF